MREEMEHDEPPHTLTHFQECARVHTSLMFSEPQVGQAAQSQVMKLLVGQRSMGQVAGIPLEAVYQRCRGECR